MRTMITRLPLMLVVCAVVVLTACKKETPVDEIIGDNNSEQNLEDTRTMSMFTNDAVFAVSDMRYHKTGDEPGLSLCGTRLDNSKADLGIYTIIYDGKGCFATLSPSGTITITLLHAASGIRWEDAGAKIRIDFNVRVKHLAMGTIRSFVGSYYITNVTGGSSFEVLQGARIDKVTHLITTDNFIINYDGRVETWNIRRQEDFENINGAPTLIVSGAGSFGNLNGIYYWGTNYNKRLFLQKVDEPIMSNTKCGLLKPVSGKTSTYLASNVFQVVYGVDQSGNPVSTETCAYGYRASELRKASEIGKTRIVAYDQTN